MAKGAKEDVPSEPIYKLDATVSLTEAVFCGMKRLAVQEQSRTQK